MKAHNLRAYLLIAAASFNAFVTLTNLSAQPQKSPVSPTSKRAALSKPEHRSEVEEKNKMSGINDFDFFIGKWRVHHRRLKERLARNDDWEQFEGTSTVQKILGGLGNMDDNVIELPSGTYRAATIRTYDPAKQAWTIWWIDSRNPGHLDPPVVGRFEKGVGTFYADDQFKGKPIRVRYLWNASAAPHWEQAFSDDGGKTWETNWTMDFTPIAMSAITCCPLVEFRQYTLVPGKRDALVDLFEREFIETQEATGMTVVGQFRDLNNPDRFVWLRGFNDMESRARQLQEFYGGPVWKKHREAANATMSDSDNVLLLRPARSDSGFRLENLKRPPHGNKQDSKVLIVATIYHLNRMAQDNFILLFEQELVPKLTKAGGSIVGMFVTENHPNTFPALPVREGENVFVSFARFANRQAYDEFAGSNSVHEFEASAHIKGKPETVLLAATARSLVR
jgi:quinol monooxygenase YgiN